MSTAKISGLLISCSCLTLLTGRPGDRLVSWSLLAASSGSSRIDDCCIWEYLRLGDRDPVVGVGETFEAGESEALRLDSHVSVRMTGLISSPPESFTGNRSGSSSGSPLRNKMLTGLVDENMSWRPSNFMCRSSSADNFAASA